MIRIVKLSGKFYGIELPKDPEEAYEEIKGFVNEGTPVIISDDLSDLYTLYIDESEVTMVERKDDEDDDY